MNQMHSYKLSCMFQIAHNPNAQPHAANAQQCTASCEDQGSHQGAKHEDQDTYFAQKPIRTARGSLAVGMITAPLLGNLLKN
jgi:hypothetical protein